MAWDGYIKGNYTTYNQWDSDKDDWNKRSYAQNGYSDHVRPQVIDSEERRKPAIYYYPNPNTEGYVTATETIVETIHAPTVIKYEYSYPAMVDTEQILKDYGLMDEKWQRAWSPVHDRPQKVDQELPTMVDFIRNLGRRSSSPVLYNRQEVEEYPKKVVFANDQGHMPSCPVLDHPQKPKKVTLVQDCGNRPSTRVHDRQQNVEEFITKIQTEGSRPSQTSSSPTYLLEPPNSSHANYQGHMPSSPVLDHPEKAKKVTFGQDYGNRPSTRVHDRQQNVEEFIAKIQTEASRPSQTSSSPTYLLEPPNSTSNNKGPISYDTMKEPPSFTKDGWEKQSNKGWSMPPSHPLTKPTNDIGTAVGFLKDAVVRHPVVTAAAPHGRVDVPVPTTKNVPGLTTKKDSYAETIDSREAARRYGKSNNSSRSYIEDVTYKSGTIDSREAMKKYKGTFV